MVVLTVCAPSNHHTIFFDQPPRKPRDMRLISCAHYNSLYNLKKKRRDNMVFYWPE